MKSAFSNSQFASVASRSSIGRLIVAVVCSIIWPLDSLLFQVNILGPEFATDETNVTWCTNVHEQLKVSRELHEKTPLQMTVDMFADLFSNAKSPSYSYKRAQFDKQLHYLHQHLFP